MENEKNNKELIAVRESKALEAGLIALNEQDLEEREGQHLEEISMLREIASEKEPYITCPERKDPIVPVLVPCIRPTFREIPRKRREDYNRLAQHC